ncbi:MBL fold metallo-hydrolase [Castellaniella sp.]|uniref:MBL fold metallo-hydrolase n=1 Tax=Castellaniella sp. TaxID=1955812 RepID=UPI002AFFE35D|nr:MBL fold metallo-hydrolase [Castellaniella sp.]
MPMHIQPFYDDMSGTISYVLSDPDTRMAAIIDPVLDYEPKSGRTSTASAQKILDYLHDHNLSTQWILETHAHADHLSAAVWLRQQTGGRIGIGAAICQVQSVFSALYNLGDDFPVDGSQFDHLFVDEEVFHIGNLSATALLVPGHTPADMAYQIGDAVFTGDTLFMPDLGTARTDFPGGDARRLYQSIQRLLALPGQTRLFACHDYPPETRVAAWESTVASQKAHNIHVRDGVSADEFVALRQARDATLTAPALILPALQVNIQAGQLPLPESNGRSYLKIPLNALK